MEIVVRDLDLRLDFLRRTNLFVIIIGSTYDLVDILHSEVEIGKETS